METPHQLPIVLYPDPSLRKSCQPIAKMTDELDKRIDEMFYTMYQANGIGLAAPQVDFHQRLIVVDVSEDKSEPMALINPKILDARGEIKWEEGCLSIPGVYGEVTRPSEILVEAMDREGKIIRFEAYDLKAVCIQHEIDHLNGILFTDHLSRLKRQRALKKMVEPKYPTKAL